MYLFIIVLSPKFNTAEPLKYPLQDLHVTSPTGHMPPIGTYDSNTTICTNYSGFKSDLVRTFLFRHLDALWVVPQWRWNASLDLIHTMHKISIQYEHLKLRVVITVDLTFFPILGNTASLPFKVERTSTGQLPVFSDIRNGRTNVLTIVRRCAGDLAVSFKALDLT
jgi:hypothetical protein